MNQPPRNRQMFALPTPPPQRLVVGGVTYGLQRVFKHDFWAATCLYVLESPMDAAFSRIVVKFGRRQSFLGLPLQWIGRWLVDHEQAIYHRLRGVEGIPRWVDRLDETCCAIEYIDAPPLDHLDSLPVGLFDRLADIFRAVHDRGVAYGDANKRSNILVLPDGQPVLIDFQISLRTRDNWPWPISALLRRAVQYLADKDLYHLYKHKRRLAPDELTPEEDALSRRRGGLHGLHRKLTKPYRAIRRTFLRRQNQRGQLVSPSAEWEDHHQPEKESWRD